ncbi:MAG TPA: hypothetical protein VMB34_12290 [Acetobacteraceae bacterium]|nr:hypothetical protein [Acetobacteraceae bacterium]
MRFALITGSNDFRHGTILAIASGGVARYRLRARLFDVPGMGHAAAGAENLGAPLDYRDSDR